MKFSKVGSLTKHNEIVGQIDAIVLSILRNLGDSDASFTWYTIALANLPEELRQQNTPITVDVDPRNMAFGPDVPCWAEELISKPGLEQRFHAAVSSLGHLATFTQLIELLRRDEWFETELGTATLTPEEGEELDCYFEEMERELAAEKLGQEIETPVRDRIEARERAQIAKRIAESPDSLSALQKEARSQAVIQLLALTEIPEAQTAAVLNGHYDSLLALKERAYIEGRVSGKVTVRIPNWVLDAQSREPTSLTAPRYFLRQGDEYVALIVFRNRIFKVATPYVDSDTVQEAFLKVKKLTYSDEGRVNRLKQQVAAMEGAASSAPRRTGIPEAVKLLVWTRDGGKCVRCGSSDKLHFDHIIPVTKGGGNTEDNIQILCEHCNLRKSDNIAF